MDDVKAETGTAFRPPRGEEWIEDVSLVFLRNTASVVGEGDFDELGPDTCSLKQHIADSSIGKTMGNSIEDQVGQHLPVSARIAVEDDVSGYVERQWMTRLGETRHYAGDDLLGCSFKVEVTAICKTAVDGNLLEGLNELTGTLQIGDQLVGRIAVAVDKFGQGRTAHRT